jgi:hypothetical protein
MIPDACQSLLFETIGQKAVVPNPHESIRQHVHQEAANELAGRQR